MLSRTARTHLTSTNHPCNAEGGSPARSEPTRTRAELPAFLSPATLRMLSADCVEPTLAARHAFTDRLGELAGWKVRGGGPSLLLACVERDEDAALKVLARDGVRASPGRAFGVVRAAVRLSFSGVSVAEGRSAAERVAALRGLFTVIDDGGC